MSDRLRFWRRALSRGALSLNNAAGWFSLIVLFLGVAAGITVPVVFHLSHWLTAAILMVCVVFAVAEGSYLVWAETEHRVREAEHARTAAEVALKAEQSKPRQTGFVIGGTNHTLMDNQTIFLSPPDLR